MEKSWSSGVKEGSKAQPKVYFPKTLENNEKKLNNASPYMPEASVSGAGFNIETPIVNVIIGNVAGSLSTKKSEAGSLTCEICDCEVPSSLHLEFHINGLKHKKKLKALEVTAQLKEGKEMGIEVGDGQNPNAYRCKICSLTVNSPQQLDDHLAGAKHRKKLAKAALLEAESNEENENPYLRLMKGLLGVFLIKATYILSVVC